MNSAVIALLVSAATTLVQPLLYVFSEQLAKDFLFGGALLRVHLTKCAVEKYVGRYTESIDTLNRALVLSVAFVPIALLPSASSVKIPIIDYTVSLQDWLRVCPAISYGLQIFTLTSLAWFLLLRRGLALLRKELVDAEHFGDVSNVLLTGPVGSLWMLIMVKRHIPTAWHLLWFAPVIAFILLVILSPSLLRGYFVHRLFALKDFVPAVAYLVMLIPSLLLALVLIAFSVVAGFSEIIPGESQTIEVKT